MKKLLAGCAILALAATPLWAQSYTTGGAVVTTLHNADQVEVVQSTGTAHQYATLQTLGNFVRGGSSVANVASGGTGLSAITAHDLVIGNGTSPLTLLAPSATSGVPLVSQGASANPAYGTAVVAGGGTGATSLTAHGVLLGEGTGAVTPTAAGTTGQLLLAATGSDPGWATTLPGNYTFSGTNSFSGQIVSTFGTPTIASGACGATTNGSVSGTNQSGLITIGAASTTTCTVSFSTTITAPNACVVFPANATAAATGTTVAYVSAITTAHFVLTGSALASANYYYQCL